MTDNRLRMAIGALALGGLAIAAYLSYVRSTGATLACATRGCETVQQSRYAEVLSVPVAVLGVGGYLALLGTLVAGGEVARAATTSLALAAFLFSAYLLVVQFAVIGAVCDWCVVNDVVVTVIAALALLRVRAASLPAPG